MLKPKERADALEQAAELPGGKEERFTGYGIMGLPFVSGHILCLRRWPASSVGPGYTSVWHRRPNGEWTFIQSAAPREGCARYFGSAITTLFIDDINIAWSDSWNFRVNIDGEYRVNWQVSLDQTLANRVINALGTLTPDPLWRKEWFLTLIGKLGSVVLGAGRLKLTGQVPNGQKTFLKPEYLCEVSSGTATVNGQDLGKAGPLPQQARLGDIWLPQSGRFFVAQAFMESFDPDRHRATTSQES